MATDTLQNNESLIQEALRDAKLVEVPSVLKDDPVVHRGDETLEAPMTVKELSSAGYVYVWDTRTFERAPVLYYMVAAKLRERRPDGSFIWTTNDPGKLPKRGTHKCLLHPDSPKRAEYDSMGLRTCKKSNIINDFEVKQHMMKKHPKEWQAIEDVRKEAERQEDRKLQQLMVENISGKKLEEPKPEPKEEVSPLMGVAPLYVSDKLPKPRKKRTTKK